MKKIWKYPLNNMRNEIQMPAAAKIIHVGENPEHSDQPTVWAMVNPEAALEPRILCVTATGEEILDANREYIGTGVMSGGLVWHIFEAIIQ